MAAECLTEEQIGEFQVNVIIIIIILFCYNKTSSIHPRSSIFFPVKNLDKVGTFSIP